VNSKRLLINAELKAGKYHYVPISKNDLFAFSSTYALSIYPIDAIYTFIPKNACSTLRYSIAVANGFLEDIDDIGWIHSNNKTFISTQREIALAKYTFVVLRCPYTRVASCFLDVIAYRKFIKVNDSKGERLSVNFNEFLLIIKSQIRSDRNIHWRNQSDFLHYQKYDDYFALESFSKSIDSLNDHGFQVHDTRAALKNDISNLKKVNGDFSKIKDVDLKKMKNEGIVPSYKSMFSNAEIELVKEIYIDDINLYKSHFGDKDLLF